MPSDDFALKLVSRSVSIRSVLEHWSSASTYDSFHSIMKEYIAENIGNPQFNHLQKSSFRITVETFNKKIQQKDKIDKIETLTYLPFNGEVDLKNPDFEYYYMEYYGHDSNNAPSEPCQIFFGKWVCKIETYFQLIKMTIIQYFRSILAGRR